MLHQGVIGRHDNALGTIDPVRAGPIEDKFARTAFPRHMTSCFRSRHKNCTTSTRSRGCGLSRVSSMMSPALDQEKKTPGQLPSEQSRPGVLPWV
jgi:hypothetical protein